MHLHAQLQPEQLPWVLATLGSTELLIPAEQLTVGCIREWCLCLITVMGVQWLWLKPSRIPTDKVNQEWCPQITGCINKLNPALLNQHWHSAMALKLRVNTLTKSWDFPGDTRLLIASPLLRRSNMLPRQLWLKPRAGRTLWVGLLKVATNRSHLSTMSVTLWLTSPSQIDVALHWADSRCLGAGVTALSGGV